MGCNPGVLLCQAGGQAAHDEGS